MDSKKNYFSTRSDNSATPKNDGKIFDDDWLRILIVQKSGRRSTPTQSVKVKERKGGRAGVVL